MIARTESELAGGLAKVAGGDPVLTGESTHPYLSDATEAQALRGRADAVVLPSAVERVAAIIAWCYDHGVPAVPRGGGTGYSGGCVPDGGVVVALDHLNAVRSFDPLLWRIELEAGVTTRTLQRLARENGLYYPVDPGAAEQSQIGGNVATNAGGPHAFKYGVTGAWVTGIEAVVPPGEIVRFGGGARKDVAGYDLRSLLVGSEGTLAIITAATFRFIPAVEVRFPVVGFYPDVSSGAAAVMAAMASGTVPAAIEYLDAPIMAAAGGSFPRPLPEGLGLVVISEADGELREAVEGRGALLEAMSENAIGTYTPTSEKEVSELWRWREGVGLAVDARSGGKMSEDIGVPLDRLDEAIERTVEIGKRRGLAAGSWGHAGDGNLHSTFMFDRTLPAEVARATAAIEDLFDLAIELGGTISGEHGVGLVKSGHLRKQWSPAAVELHRGIKNLLDPKGLMNPGKKVA